MRGLTILACDLDVSAIRPPLSLFNVVAPDRDGMWKLVVTVNSRLEERGLKPTALGRAFEAYWAEFTSKFKEIVESTPETTQLPPVSQQSMLEEVLGHVRGMDRRLRALETSSAKRKPIIGSVPKGVEHYLDELATLSRVKDEARSLSAAGLNSSQIADALSEHFSRFEIREALIALERSGTYPDKQLE